MDKKPLAQIAYENYNTLSIETGIREKWEDTSELERRDWHRAIDAALAELWRRINGEDYA